MSNLQVRQIKVSDPIIIIGKLFYGDYSKSRQYVTDVETELKETSTPFIKQTVVGVYYDNPQEKNAADLKSFHGVIATPDISAIPETLTKLSICGDYLYVKVAGEDVMKAIYDGYNALFTHLQQKNLKLKSPAGYQISTFNDGNITTEIYLELDM
jgi:hypothetical protein